MKIFSLLGSERLSIIATFFASIMVFLQMLVSSDIINLKRTEIESLPVQLTQTLDVLRENSRLATELSTRLHIEVSKRAEAIRALEDQLKDLRQQKTLLDLPPEQKEALQRLIKKSSTTFEILTSSDFWFGQIFGNVIVSALFFWLGVQYQRKQDIKQSHAEPSS